MQSILLLKDNIEIMFELHPISSLLFYSFSKIPNALNIKKNVEVDYKSLKNYDEDYIDLGKSYDCIISFLSLNYSNDLIGSLVQYNNHLKKNKLFLGIFFVGNTLIELKNCLIIEDEKSYGKVFPRIIPMINPKIVPQIAQRARLKNPIISVEKIKINYNSLKDLIEDLRSLTQLNFLRNKSMHLDHKNYFKNVEKLYFERFSEHNKICATFEFIILLSSNNNN